MPQPQPRERAGTAPPAASWGRAAALAGVLALLPLTAACSAGGETEADNKPSKASASAAAVVAPARIEVIANLTGCKANIRVEAEELREGTCRTEQGDYLITTFPEEKYKQTWLETARVYGGTYLVGSRWVVSAEPKMLEPLRKKIGGNIQRLQGFGPTPSPS
ncbi:hypothetical protein ABZ678_04875 [Streptomyces hirsutus]|uniref:hypothetical protein n=1 Tax=Streptomyces hirsutus TaxID=35620 RepID=UPI0033CDB04E